MIGKMYTVQVPANPLTANSGFKITLNIENYLNEPIVFSYIYRHDVPESCILHKVEPCTYGSYANKVVIIATIHDNLSNEVSSTQRQLVFEIPGNNIDRNVIQLHELGIMLTTDKCKNLLLDKLNHNPQTQSIRASITDEDSNLLFSCLANDPDGKISKWFLCFNGIVIPVKFTHVPLLPKQFILFIKQGNNTVMEYELPNDQFEELNRKNSATILHFQEGYVVIGTTYEEVVSKYKEYINEITVSSYQSVKSGFELEMNKYKKQIEQLNSQIEILTTEKKTTENSLNRTITQLKDQVEELKLENDTFRKKLKELGISTEIMLSQKKLDADLKKTEAEIHKYNTLKDVTEVNKETAELKKEKEEISTYKEKAKMEYEQTQMHHKEVITGMEIAKEALKYFSAFVAPMLGAYTLHSLQSKKRPSDNNRLMTQSTSKTSIPISPNGPISSESKPTTLPTGQQKSSSSNLKFLFESSLGSLIKKL